MSNVLKHHNSKWILIGKIKGLAIESKKTRKKILQAKVPTKVESLADRKRAVSNDARNHLLAYAFLRGTPYKKLEPSCADGNEPNLDQLYDIILAHKPLYVNGSVRFYCPTLRDIRVWMGLSTSNIEKEKEPCHSSNSSTICNNVNKPKHSLFILMVSRLKNIFSK